MTKRCCISSFVILCTFALSCVLVYILSMYQSEPYMDEVFHVRQTLKYIQGDWKSWDSKITTPPGLYLIFVSAFRVLDWLNIAPAKLMMINFRFTSVLFSLFNHMFILRLLKLTKSNFPNTLALAIITEPVLFFFSALYYTDHCSVLFVIASVCFSFQHKTCLSALFLSYAVFTRQSNIVWVPLLMCIRTSLNFSRSLFANQRCSSPFWVKKVLNEITSHPVSVAFLVFENVFRLCLPFVLVLISFLIFVVF
ncbi:unnamed protein product, partial [Heterobilharzia americana]